MDDSSSYGNSTGDNIAPRPFTERRQQVMTNSNHVPARLQLFQNSSEVFSDFDQSWTVTLERGERAMILSSEYEKSNHRFPPSFTFNPVPWVDYSLISAVGCLF